MRPLFEVDDPRADPAYLNTRLPRHRGAQRARNCCDELWREFEPYAGAHFLAEFPYRFHQRWFEMYLAVALLRTGLDIRCPEGGAPDVRVQYRDGRVLWLEATAPTGGDESNPDHVAPFRRQPGETSAGGYVPTDRVTMRVSGALHEKANKLRLYRERGIIAPEDEAIIAINVNLIPHGFFDAERYGLGATYGVGPQYVVIDRETGEPVRSGYQHRPELLRSSGSSVDVAPFLHPEFAHVAGALISGADAANCPMPLGLDFMLLPNPNALPRYSERQLPIGREWRFERDGEGYRLAEIVEHSKPMPTVSLYHATTLEAARNIVATGFVDSSQELHQGRLYRGVWLSDARLIELAPVILLVVVPEPLVREYELLGESHGYRRWLVPAELLNSHASIAELDDDPGRGGDSGSMPR